MLFTSLISTQANAGWWGDAVSAVKSLGGAEVAVAEQVVSSGVSNGGLSVEDISKAFKQALTIGSEKVVARFGQVDGFNTDPSVHIPLRKNLERIRKTLETAGLSGYVDDLELKLKRLHGRTSM